MSGDLVVGVRVADGGTFQEPWPPPNGAYWRDERRAGDPPDQWVWYVITPNGLLGCLAKHQVIEHEDGTITVSPSILVTLNHAGQSYHGYLERGSWREC